MRLMTCLCPAKNNGLAPPLELTLYLGQKARERCGSPRLFHQTCFIDTMILINPASTYVMLFQSRLQVHNDFYSILLPLMLCLFHQSNFHLGQDYFCQSKLHEFYLAMLVQLQDIQTIGLHPRIHGPTIHSNENGNSSDRNV